MKINIYIKSSVKTLKRQSGVVGFVIEAEGFEGRTVTQFGTVQDVTDNQAQLLALKYALKRLKDRTGAVIWTDNNYIAAAFTQNWIKGWKDRDWKTVKGQEVANCKEWLEVLELLGDCVPTFRVKEDHSYSTWLQHEVERRAKKHGNNSKTA